MSSFHGSILIAALLVACSESKSDFGNERGSAIALSLAESFDAIQPNGVTTDPDTGRLYILDSMQGLFAEQPDGSFVMLADTSLLYSISTASEYTDIAALGDDRFALTARNDGFLLDLRSQTIEQHFCYLPGFFIGQPRISQLTLGLAFDPISERIIAQPITTRDENEILQSQVGTFPLSGGEGEDWHPIDDPNFLAGGIAVDHDGLLWLGDGGDLYRYDLATDSMEFDQNLGRFGVDQIDGMTFTEESLIVVNEETAMLTRIPLERL